MGDNISSNLIELARDQYASDDLEIDDDAKVSESSEGVWVQAWVWLDNAHLSRR